MTSAAPSSSASTSRSRRSTRGPRRDVPPAAVAGAATAPRTPDGVSGFPALGVPPALVDVLTAAGISTPTPIQLAAVPDALAGRDVLGAGRTGSGKTLAFALPLVARLAELAGRSAPRRPRGLVLVPTRELARQVAEVAAPLAGALGMRVATVFGGVSQGAQVTALRSGVDVLVACPGRLADLINQGHVGLEDIAVTVVDEADHMSDMGFLPAVTRLLAATPASGQRLLFSATLDSAVDALASRFLPAAVVHRADPVAAPPVTMTHRVVTVDEEGKAAVVRELAGGHGRRLLFTRTKHRARKLARTLTSSGVPAVDLHGNLSQPARERNLAAFATGSVRVLVATDIAARGIHVDDVDLVVHVDPPVDHKAYLHRSGRTARAGASGEVVIIATPDQQAEVAALLARAGVARSGPSDLMASGVGSGASARRQGAAPPRTALGRQAGGRRRGGSSGRSSGTGRAPSRAA